MLRSAIFSVAIVVSLAMVASIAFGRLAQAGYILLFGIACICSMFLFFAREIAREKRKRGSK